MASTSHHGDPNGGAQTPVLATAGSRRKGLDAPREAVVEARGLTFAFGQGDLRKQVLTENDLDLFPGEIVIMTGPSGSGKTTLLTLIGALRSVQEGSLTVLGRELRGLSPRELVGVRRGIGFIFQAHNLFGSLTAMQNVLMALELSGRDRRAMRQRATELLTELGLGHRIDYKPASLSGGQRQRVAIARALAAYPGLILADEPTAALDKQSGRDVVNLLQRYAREHRSTIMMVTHDNRILDVADRIVNMVDGRIVSDVLCRESAKLCEFLHSVPLFSHLLAGTLSQVADKIVVEQFPPGAVVLRQGDTGDKFYLIKRGAVEVTKTDEHGPRVEAVLTEDSENRYFGEAALLTGEPRNATVTAMKDLELYALEKSDFIAAVESSASFKEQLTKVLFERQ